MSSKLNFEAGQIGNVWAVASIHASARFLAAGLEIKHLIQTNMLAKVVSIGGSSLFKRVEFFSFFWGSLVGTPLRNFSSLYGAMHQKSLLLHGTEMFAGLILMSRPCTEMPNKRQPRIRTVASSAGLCSGVLADA